MTPKPMLTSSDRERLGHILDAIDKLASALAGYDLDRFSSDWQKQLVVERLFEIIGEAARHLSPEVQANHPDVPWTKMVGIRNVVSHEYFRVDAETLWRTAIVALPSLRTKIAGILV